MYRYRKASAEERDALLAERRARNLPLHQTPHLHGENHLYLVTAACFEHRHHLLDTIRRAELSAELRAELNASHVDVLAWVVLPNHYHVLVRAESLRNVSSALKLVHGRSSHRINAADGVKGRRVWYRYSDRALRSEAHLNTSLNYVHFNPVKHGWAASPYDWQESSVHAYLNRFGRDWLRALWADFPLRDYGKGWDDSSELSAPVA